MIVHLKIRSFLQPANENATDKKFHSMQPMRVQLTNTSMSLQPANQHAIIYFVSNQWAQLTEVPYSQPIRMPLTTNPYNPANESAIYKKNLCSQPIRMLQTNFILFSANESATLYHNTGRKTPMIFNNLTTYFCRAVKQKPFIFWEILYDKSLVKCSGK